MLKIAIVGTGIIGKDHVNAIKNVEGCKLVALCDINEESVKAFAEECNVPYFLDYKDIPSKVDCDAVILNLPHFLHAPASIFFLDHGMHVLVEKPMANSVEECEAMIEAAKRNNKKLAVAHIQRYFKNSDMIKDMIESGELGKLCMYTEARTIDYFLPTRPKWFLDKKLAGGGIVMNYGAHAFDKLFYVTGARPVSIDANCSNIKNDATIEGHAQIFAKFDNGMTASITFSGYSTVIYECYYYFTNGAIRVKGSDLIDVKIGNEPWKTVPDTRDGLAIYREIVEFCKFVNGEEANIPDAEYGKDVISAIEQVFTHIV